jgi:N-acetylglutamate synthase-like GNAT family acetyltransferase
MLGRAVPCAGSGGRQKERTLATIEICRGEASGVAEVNRFYASFQFGSVARDGDTLILARQSGQLAGVVRLCREHGHFVLRGMLVDAVLQHQGIGRRLLAVLVGQLDGHPCYALPFRHLPAFYGCGGFRPCRIQDAPAHLQQRYIDYRTSGLDVLVMKRPAS